MSTPKGPAAPLHDKPIQSHPTRASQTADVFPTPHPNHTRAILTIVNSYKFNCVADRWKLVCTMDDKTKESISVGRNTLPSDLIKKILQSVFQPPVREE